MHHPTDRIAHITAFVTPVVEHWLEREIAQWVHHDRIAGVVFYPGARCIFIAALADGAMGIRIDPPMVDPIFLFSQCSTTGVIKAVLCAILSVGRCIIK